MITLKTLHLATAQQVFNQVAEHLLTQKEKAQDPLNKACYYRYTTKGGKILKCAGGVLISDEEFSKLRGSENGTTWLSLIRTHDLSDTHSSLIGALQAIHDTIPVDDWYKELEDFAVNHHLTSDVLAKFLM